MKIAICDDEKIYCDRLHDMLISNSSAPEGGAYEITAYDSGLALTSGYICGQYDAVFLDVDMPGLSGFDTAQRIRDLDLDVAIVFVTHLESHIHMGYRYGAKEYLCKPITQQQVDDLMARLLKERRRRYEAGMYEVELKFGGTMYLPLHDVMYFESQGHYVQAVMQQAQYTFRNQLQSVAADLESKGFVRIHQSFLVNKQHVFKDFGDYVLLKTGERLTISRRHKDAVSKAFKGVWN